MTEYEKTHKVAKSVEEAEKHFKEFKVETLSKFSIFRRNKGFSKDLDCKLQLVCFYWQSVYEYTSDIRRGLTYTYLYYFFFFLIKLFSN